MKDNLQGRIRVSFNSLEKKSELVAHFKFRLLFFFASI